MPKPAGVNSPPIDEVKTILPGRFSSIHLRMKPCASASGAKTLVS